MGRLSPSRALQLSALVVLALLYAAWGVCGTLTELGGDSATYMLMARQLSPFLAADPTLAGPLAGVSYPPLFPLLIGLFGGSFVAAHALVIAALVSSFMLLYRLLRMQRFDTTSAAAAVLLFAAMPGTYLLALNIWSENLYLALSLLALLALERKRRDAFDPDGRRWWLSAAAAAAAVMARTAGLPLLATFSVFAVRKHPRHWPWMILAAWLPFLAWMLVSRLHGGGASQYTQQLVTQYGHDPLGHLYTQLQMEFHAIGNAWLAAWLGFAAPPALTLLIQGFGMLCIAGCLLRLVHGYADACYTVLYLLMLLIWPWPGEAPRLLYAILPLALAGGLQVLQSLAAALPGSTRTIRTALMVALLLPVLPGVFVAAQRRLAPAPAGLEVIRHIAGYYSDDKETDLWTAWAQAQLLSAIPRIANQVPAADCVFSIKPSVIMLLAGRVSLAPPATGASDAEFLTGMSRCRYAYATSFYSTSYPVSFYPINRLAGRYHVLSELPDSVFPQDEPLARLVDLSTTSH